jgi:ABC-2 type transport system ATP-binding protein
VETGAPDETAPEPTPRKPAAKRTPTKKTTQAKPRATKPRGASAASRPKPVVAADAAAPTSETVASPAVERGPAAEDAAADDAQFDAHFTALLAAETTDPEPTATPEPAETTAETAEAETAESELAETEPAEAETAEAEPEAPDAAAAVPAVVDDAITMPASAQHAVLLRDLVKDFGDQRAVNGIDLSIPAGSFYGIVGPNGAGKTTTLSIVAGLLRATSGQVVVCGIDLADDALGAKRMMGVLPDRLRTFDRLTGRQLLHYYGLLRGLPSEVIEKRTADLARAFDLADALSRVVSDYSAGMTKKIMLAGAMIHSPRVLVLDEPFEAVDPVSSAVILDILRAYVAHGGTVILSSHGMDLVERVCSRVAVIVGGDVLAEGTIDEVRAGQTLEARFVELSGGVGEVEGLEWLHTFSD